MKRKQEREIKQLMDYEMKMQEIREKNLSKLEQDR